jgi:exosortase
MAQGRSGRLGVSDWPADPPVLTRPEEGRGGIDRGGQTPERWVGSALAALVFLAVLAALYGPMLRDLVWQWWDDPNYSHGFLVPVVSGFLIWQRRKELRALTPKGSRLGLAVLLLGIGALLLGDIGAENFLLRSSLILVLAGLVLFHLGWRIFRVLAFPLAFLIFMVPLPATVFYAVAFPLQNFAARNAAGILDLLGVPVLLDGNIIHLSQISLGVTEACSGIRSLISLLAVAVAWASLTLPSLWAILILVASAVPITIIANAGRVVTTGLIGQWFGVEYAEGFFHTFAGWVIFFFGFACLLGVHGAISLVLTRWKRT